MPPRFTHRATLRYRLRVYALNIRSLRNHKKQPYNNMKLLAVFALKEEIVPVSFKGWDVVTVQTGITEPYAAARLGHAIATEKPDLVINFGTAGTLKFNVGDVLVCTRFVERNIASGPFTSVASQLTTDTPFAASFPSIVGGKTSSERFTVNTGSDFVTAESEIDGDAVDMEAFANALTAKEFGVPFFAVKYITDVIGQNSMKIWEERLSAARTALSQYLAVCKLPTSEN